MWIIQFIIVGIIAIFLASLYERWQLYLKQGHLPGPLISIPFIGPLPQIILQPFKFYEKQESYGPLSWFSVFGRFILFAKDPELSRMFYKSDNFVPMAYVGKKIIGEDSFIFMNAHDHKEVRRKLLPLFTRAALSIYIPIQQKVIKEHINYWIELSENGKKQFPIRNYVRDLNVFSSIEVFVGPYTTPEKKKELGKMYLRMNEGFLGIPIPIPGLALWKAMKAQKIVNKILLDCVKSSRAKMSSENSVPNCLLDVLMVTIINKEKAKMFLDETCETITEDNMTDENFALILMTFLFASQDASTSSLVWVCTLLDKYPDILQKVREELHQLLEIPMPTNNDETISIKYADKINITPEKLAKIPYIKQVALEILRYRPPAMMLPLDSMNDFKIPEINYTVPKGSLIMPSIWCARNVGFEDPEKFDPERFANPRNEHVKNAKNYLVFGTGPRRCLGKEYAINQLMLFISLMALNVNWKRKKIPNQDEIIFGPTIFPADGCTISLTRR